jgi:hypothetical protein
MRFCNFSTQPPIGIFHGSGTESPFFQSPFFTL